jgi:hypothetical protein
LANFSSKNFFSEKFKLAENINIAASVQQWRKKILVCSQNDDLKIEKLIF